MRKVLPLKIFFLFTLLFSKYTNIDIDISHEIDTLEPFEILQVELLENIKTPEEAKPSIWPVVGMVTSEYGWRRRGRYLEFHAGIDIAAKLGTPVVATAPGSVIFAGYVRGYGYVVIIYHGYGYTTVYAHMSGIEVKKGDEVARGSIVGYVGNTGRATGPHLHYEVLKYGIRQNPIIYLP